MPLQNYQDEVFMREALRLAKKGAGRTHPNPLVGAVLVQNGRVIARGYHRGFGRAHAEIEALRTARENVVGATLYVTLEPCRHFGKTPPCTDAIISAGIRRVVCATRDPHPKAQGGVVKLKRAGIAVSVGILREAAEKLNAPFFVFHKKHRPFVALKYAASLDGKLATRTGDSKWITNERARAYARRLRGLHQAVLVGVGTVIADDPHLGSRLLNMPDPIRIILDSHLRIPFHARVLRDSRAIVVTTKHAPLRKRILLERRGIRVVTCAGNHISPQQILSLLKKQGIVSVFVEGGGAIIGSFIDAGVVDVVYAFYAPLLIGGTGAVSIGGRGARNIPDALSFKDVSLRHFGDNILIAGSVSRRSR